MVDKTRAKRGRGVSPVTADAGNTRVTPDVCNFSHEVSADLLAIARRLCPPRPVVCDIGSRDALDGLCLCKSLDATECHIFEPNPSAIELCQANIARYGKGCKVFFNPVALTDNPGPVSFFAVNAGKSDNKDIGFSSLFPVNPAYASKRRGAIVQDRITVTGTTLDLYFRNRQNQPDLLWIDVEGAEKLVLNGAQETLRHVALIHIEVSFRPMQTGKPLFWEIDSFLRESNFRLVKFIGVSRAMAFLMARRLLPNLPWRLDAAYCRGTTSALVR